MPYYRRRRQGYNTRRSYRRRNYPRRPRQNPGQYYGGMAYRAYRMGRTALSLLNVETKYHDTLINSNPSSTTWLEHDINMITQGDTGSTRDGNKVRAKTVTLSGDIQISAAAVNSRIKIALVLLPQGTGSIQATTQVYDSASVDALRNLNYATKSTVLWSKLYVLDTGSLRNRSIRLYRKISLPVHFNSDTSVEKNLLKVLMISTEATNTPSVGINARVGYIDN